MLFFDSRIICPDFMQQRCCENPYILTMLSLSNSSITTIVGYGFTNLGYLFAAAGVIGGSYRALALDHRIQVFSAAIIFFLAGLFLFNF